MRIDPAALRARAPKCAAPPLSPESVDVLVLVLFDNFIAPITAPRTSQGFPKNPVLKSSSQLHRAIETGRLAYANAERLPASCAPFDSRIEGLIAAARSDNHFPLALSCRIC